MVTEIYLRRTIFTNGSTIGRLSLNDLELWTLEDTCRMIKVFGETAIPSGSYNIDIRESKRYGRLMPYVLDVPFFEGIMIHPGNFPADTHGCILVGMGHTVLDKIDESKRAFELLFPQMEAAIKNGGLKIKIAGGYSKEDFGSKKI